MPFVIRHKSTMPASLYKKLGEDIEIIDVTSKAPEPWQKLSPFYPHGGIPIPFSPTHTSQSVEGIWQGLKVFEAYDIDPVKFTNDTMKKLKRTVRKYGRVRGHRAGVDGEELLSYRDARWLIYLPAYKYMLDHCVQSELEELRALGEKTTVVLLDYEKNDKINNTSKPLSHASLIKRYLDGEWPTLPDDLRRADEAP
ncbi:MAG: hypothetical protein CL920_19830 [Deltaproteobacteria bacterium]|nr:hypothetical protein [Deltaproteobacteria bacterium]MBU50940.1 hypothetical protein [Deltaproteobacteria bacterium]